MKAFNAEFEELARQTATEISRALTVSEKALQVRFEGNFNEVNNEL